MKRRRVKTEADFSFRIVEPVHPIKIGDKLRTVKGKEFQIIDIFRFQGRKVYRTDRFGLVYADEIHWK